MPVRITAREHSVAEVFSDDFRLLLPYFQRGYAWKTGHAGRLFSNVLAMAENENGLGWYPLGTIIVAKLAASPEAMVADGHQRLITLTIILSILRDLEKERELKARLAACIESTTYAGDRSAASRLTTFETARACLHTYVQAPDATAKPYTESEDQTSESEANIIANRDELRRSIQSLRPGRRQAFARFLLDECMVLVSAVPSQEVASLLFSTMHDTGLRPTSLDLFKAQVLDRVAPEERDQSSIIWEGLEARLGQARFDALLGHVAVIAKRELPRRHVHAVLQSHFDLEEAHGAQSFIERRLAGVGQHAMAIVDAINGHGVMPPTLARRLQYLCWVANHDTWMIPVLHWLEHRGATHEETLELVRRIEALAWAQLIRTEEPSRRDQRYVRILEELDRGQAFAPGSALAVTADEAREVANVLATANIIKRSYKHDLLLRISATLEGDDRVRPAALVTIEHVIPKRPAGKSQWKSDFTEQQLGQYRNMLGNLALLTVAEQDLTKNFEFALKRPVFAASTCPLTRRLGDYTSWTPRDVEVSTAEMIRALFTSWDFDLSLAAPPYSK